MTNLLQRALLTWTGSEWRPAHARPGERYEAPSEPGAFIGQTYDTETERLSKAWVIVDERPPWQNCTDFAFRGDPDLVLVSDLDELLQKAAEKGYVETRSASDGTIALFGSGRAYSHAMRRVGSQWQEVTALGGQLRRYTGAENPPPVSSGDGIVAMLDPPRATGGGGARRLATKPTLARKLRASYHVTGFEHFNAQQAYERFAQSSLSADAREALESLARSEKHDLVFSFGDTIDDPDLRGLTKPMASGVQFDPDLKHADVAAYHVVVKILVKADPESGEIDLVKLVRTMQHEVEFHVVPIWRRLWKKEQEYGHREQHGNPEVIARAWTTYLTNYRAQQNPALAARYFEDVLQDLHNSFTVVDPGDLQIEDRRLTKLLSASEDIALEVFAGSGGTRKMLHHLRYLTDVFNRAVLYRTRLDFDRLGRRAELASWG